MFFCTTLVAYSVCSPIVYAQTCAINKSLIDNHVNITMAREGCGGSTTAGDLCGVYDQYYRVFPGFIELRFEKLEKNYAIGIYFLCDSLITSGSNDKIDSIENKFICEVSNGKAYSKKIRNYFNKQGIKNQGVHLYYEIYKMDFVAYYCCKKNIYIPKLGAKKKTEFKIYYITKIGRIQPFSTEKRLSL
jgi:hypothetical protein